jgi:hypothetical protein
MKIHGNKERQVRPERLSRVLSSNQASGVPSFYERSITAGQQQREFSSGHNKTFYSSQIF